MILPQTKQYIGKRVAVTLIDYTLFYACFFGVIFLFGRPNNQGGYSVTGWPVLIPVVLWFCYFVLAEAKFGGTLAHQLLGLEVVSTDGRRPTFSQTFLRRVADAIEISWCFGLIAFIIANSTESNQRLGDLWAKTVVVRKNEEFGEELFDFEKDL